MVCAPEYQSANHVDHQSQHRHSYRFGVLDGLRKPDAVNRAEDHHERHTEQHNRAGKPGEYFNLPTAESKARVARVGASGDVSRGRQTDGQRVRAHVPAVSQQCHGVEPPACKYFNKHHAQRDPHHQAGAAFGGLAAFVKHVFVQPVGEGVVVHVNPRDA